MRLAAAGLILAIAIGYAQASEYDPPVLRGSNAFDDNRPMYRDWSGFYVGGHVGHGSGTADFGENGNGLIANILRGTLLQNEFNVSGWMRPKGHGGGTPLGIFFGYNWQSDDAVFGFDVTYSHLSLRAGGTDALGRNVTTSDGVNYDVIVGATMEAEITDILSLRGRAGAAFESFMPYLTLGVAVGRVNITQAASVRTRRYDDSDPPAVVSDTTTTDSDSKSGAYAIGLSAGLGFDWEIVPRLFLRGEYEYVGFAPVSHARISVHTARVGVGGRF